MLWGDFPIDDSNALDDLKKDLFRSIPFSTINRIVSPASDRSVAQQSHGLPSGQVSTSVTKADSSNTTLQTPSSLGGPVGSSSKGNQTDVRSDSTSGPAVPSNASGTPLVKLTDVTIDNGVPTYLEICTNVGNHAVSHFELDISQAATDSELFEKLWNAYDQSRGFGIRRLFLRPCDVHFVMVSNPCMLTNHTTNSWEVLS